VTFREEYDHRRGQPSDITAHLPALHHAARGRRHGLELGVRTGNSTTAFLAAIEADGGHLWSIDILAPDVPRHWHDSPLWSFLRADDLSRQARAWAPGSIDFLFIDTSHGYDHTLAELRAYAPRVSPGGMVLMHDTEFAPPDIDGADPRESGVGRALDAYCAETGLVWANTTGCYGLGIMRIP
jgi:predicted O-methyltransferase YrrM